MHAPLRRLGARARVLLRAAIVAAWFVGVSGSAFSCVTLKYYQAPRIVPTTTPPTTTAPLPDRLVRTWSEVLDRNRARHVPLAVADLLLSLALLVGAARTLARRPGAKSWLRQVCLASAAYAVVELAVRRGEWSDAASIFATLSRAPQEAGRIGADLRVAFAATVALQLALFGGLAWALGRPSVVLELAPEPNDHPRPPTSPDDEGED